MVKTFIRIPKSGSTSIIAAINQIDPNHDNRHLTVSEIRQDGQEHLFYTMIRDPLQQYVSTYYYAKMFVEQNLDFANTPQPMLQPFLEHMSIIRQTTCLEEYLLIGPSNAFLGKYLFGLDPKELICVGYLEDMDTSRRLLNEIVGLPILPVWLKKGPVDGPYTVADSVVNEFKEKNFLEYELFESALEHFHFLKSDMNKTRSMFLQTS